MQLDIDGCVSQHNVHKAQPVWCVIHVYGFQGRVVPTVCQCVFRHAIPFSSNYGYWDQQNWLQSLGR
jgi:hypothetical protein